MWHRSFFWAGPSFASGDRILFFIFLGEPAVQIRSSVNFPAENLIWTRQSRLSVRIRFFMMQPDDLLLDQFREPTREAFFTADDILRPTGSLSAFSPLDPISNESSGDRDPGNSQPLMARKAPLSRRKGGKGKGHGPRANRDALLTGLLRFQTGGMGPEILWTETPSPISARGRWRVDQDCLGGKFFPREVGPAGRLLGSARSFFPRRPAAGRCQSEGSPSPRSRIY